MPSPLQIFLEFFRLGLIAFGGPAAHAALMEKELVGRRKWITHQQFLDYLGGVNLIPGPNSTQITMLVGYQLRGFWGMIMGGLGFVIPAAAITGALAVFYVEYQSLPQLESILFGIKPAILAIIASAVIKLGKKAVKGFELGVLGLIVVVITLLGVNEITAILGAGFAGMLYFSMKKRIGQGKGLNTFFPFFLLNVASATISQYSTLKLFWIFTKIGALLFGSGYVLIAYVNAELVEKLGWITPEQLLDAIAIGQFTPGPLISSATFIGYLLDGYKGALVATAGIVLPSFIFILLLYPFIGKLRKSPLTSAFLDSVNVAAVGVMVSVSIILAKEVVIGWQPLVILIISLILVMGPWKVNSLWVVLLGGLSGILFSLV
jgi:chromate transporter